MTVGEVKEMYSGRYVDCEIWEDGGNGTFHTDNIRSRDDGDDVVDWELMDEDDYEHSVLANSCTVADFESWYGDSGAKVLCILVEGR